ncbi:MAG: hypothetical protein WCK00_10175, partial [Deltaproteobacteria bacterium]
MAPMPTEAGILVNHLAADQWQVDAGSRAYCDAMKVDVGRTYNSMAIVNGVATLYNKGDLAGLQVISERSWQSVNLSNGERIGDVRTYGLSDMSTREKWVTAGHVVGDIVVGVALTFFVPPAGAVKWSAFAIRWTARAVAFAGVVTLADAAFVSPMIHGRESVINEALFAVGATELMIAGALSSASAVSVLLSQGARAGAFLMATGVGGGNIARTLIGFASNSFLGASLGFQAAGLGDTFIGRTANVLSFAGLFAGFGVSTAMMVRQMALANIKKGFGAGLVAIAKESMAPLKGAGILNASKIFDAVSNLALRSWGALSWQGRLFAMGAASYAASFVVGDTQFAQGLRNAGIFAMSFLLIRDVGGLFFGNPFLLAQKGLSLALTGSLFSWAGAGLVVVGNLTDSKNLKEFGLIFLAMGIATRIVAGFQIARGLGGADALRGDIVLQAGSKIAGQAEAYMKNFAETFWLSAGSSVVWFRLFPVLQAAVGLDKLFGLQQGTWPQHLKNVFMENWVGKNGAFGEGGIFNSTRLVHDILLGQALHIFGISYFGRGPLGALSETQGVGRAIFSKMAPKAFSEFFGAGVGSATVLGGAVCWASSFVDNMIMFNLMLAPAQAFSKFMHPGAQAGESDYLKQLYAIPGMLFSFLTMPADLFSSFLIDDWSKNSGREGSWASFSQKLEQYALFLVPQGRGIFSETSRMREYTKEYTQGREAFGKMDAGARDVLAVAWNQRLTVRVDGKEILLAEYILRS